MAVSWESLKEDTLPKGVRLWTETPVVFEQSHGQEPMSLVTVPAHSICALTPVEAEPRKAGQRGVWDKRTVVFLRSGHIEVDLQGDVEGETSVEPLYVNVLARASRTSARNPSAGAVALAFARDLGRHDCADLPAWSTLRSRSTDAGAWKVLCQQASVRLVVATITNVTPFHDPYMRHVVGAVEVRISTGAGGPGPGGPMDLSAGMVVLVGRPSGYSGGRVLFVVEPLMPALGPNYGWTFH